MPVMTFDSLAGESADDRTGAPGHGPSGHGSTAGTVGAPPPPVIRHRHAAARPPDRDRGLRRAIAIVSAAIVVVLAALLGSVLAGGGPSPGPSGGHRSSTGVTRPAPSAPSTTNAPTSTAPAEAPTASTTTTSTTSTTSPPTGPGGAPVLTSLQPSSGGVGQAVVISGAGFFSPSGSIRATVGGQTASVSCTDQTTCTLKIPPLTGTATTEPVVVITDDGPSSPLPFTMG